ncbi:MAG TPA: OmpA family protein [Candidatus Wunengus sp. YC63]|uniref:OmpA family protein n=1 Tax=Candidatus Wunengus sp. YC63 TaxID=3367699 RepID=UPI0040278F75
MLEEHGVARGLCLVGIVGILIAGAGCGQTKKLRQENQQLNETISGLQQENADLSSKASRYESEVNRLENTRRDLEAKLKGTGATVRIKNGTVSVLLPGAVLFDSGQTTLRTQSKATLKKIAGILKTSAAGEIVRIEGHTDNDPVLRQKDKYKTNWELSAARAAAVLHYMVEECGVSPTRVYIAGFGQYQPLADNKSKTGKAKNRRVEFVIVPRGGG